MASGRAVFRAEKRGFGDTDQIQAADCPKSNRGMFAQAFGQQNRVGWAISINGLYWMVYCHNGWPSVSGLFFREFLYHLSVFTNNNAMAEASSPFTGL
jgi:hypothetical protein